MRPALIVLNALIEGKDVEYKGTLIRLDGNRLYWRSNLTQNWSPYNMSVQQLLEISERMSLSELRFLTKTETPYKSHPGLKKTGFWRGLRLKRKKV